MVSYALILLLFSCSSGFLLDNNGQQPTRASLMTDTHYNLLMSLLNDERQSRIQLENYVKQLQQDFLDVKRVVYTDVLTSLNATFDRQFSDLKNDNKALKESNRKLETNYNSLKNEFEQMKHNSTIAESNVLQLEQEVSSLRQLKTVSDLGSVLRLQNKTDHLEQALQVTNTKLEAVTNDVSARKQDFIALFNKVEGNEKILENKTSTLGQTLHNISNEEDKLAASLNQTSTQLQQLSINFQQHQSQIANKEDKLAASLNETLTQLQQLSIKFQQHQSQIANKVVLTSCAAGGTKRNGDTIQFNGVRTINGIKNEKSIRSSGTFVCENAGLYQISVYVSTNTAKGGFNVKKNDLVIADGVSSLSNNYQTATVIVLTHLSVNDKISVEVRFGDMFIFGNIESCLSILQIL